MFRHVAKLFSVLGLLLLITACFPVEVKVENLADFPDGYVGKKISVHNYVEREENGLEWKRYRPVFESEFRKKGFIVTTPDQADYWAFVDYGISSPSRTQQPIYDYSTGQVTSVINKTEYARRVIVDVVNPHTEARVFEGRADSVGSCGRLGEVIDEMAEAIFEKFPSGYGHVTIAMDGNC